jgi:hypothetical protein
VRQAHTPLAGPIPSFNRSPEREGYPCVSALQNTVQYDYIGKLCGTVSKCRDAPLYALSSLHIENVARRLAMPRYYFHVRRGQMTVLDRKASN